MTTAPPTRYRQSPEHFVDYALVARFLVQHEGDVLTHPDITAWVANHGQFTEPELAAYRRGLYWLSNVVGSQSVRAKHGLPGLVLRIARGKFLYDPDASVVRLTKRKVLVDSPALRARGYQPGDEVNRGTDNQRPVVIAGRAGAPVVDEPVVEAPAAEPEPEPQPEPVAVPVPDPRNGFPLAEVLADVDGTLVLRHENGSIVVATVTARTVTTVS